MGLSCSVDGLSIILVIEEDYRSVCGFVVVVWFGLVWFWGLLLFNCLGLGFFSPQNWKCENKSKLIS